MSEEFAREVSKQAAARVCAALGFKQTQENVLEVLADVSAHFIRSLGEATAQSAELGGRSQAGWHDAISAIHNSALQTRWIELKQFAFGDGDDSNAWSQPFPGVVPSFPATPSSHKHQLRQTQPTGGGRNTSAIPAHLPAFPPAETYQRKRTRAGRRKKDTDLERQKRLKASRQLQQSIAKLSEQDGEEESKAHDTAATTVIRTERDGDQPGLALREADRPAIGNLLAEHSTPATPGMPLTKEQKILEGIVDEEDRDR